MVGLIRLSRVVMAVSAHTRLLITAMDQLSFIVVADHHLAVLASAEDAAMATAMALLLMRFAEEFQRGEVAARVAADVEVAQRLAADVPMLLQNAKSTDPLIALSIELSLVRQSDIDLAQQSKLQLNMEPDLDLSVFFLSVPEKDF